MIGFSTRIASQIHFLALANQDPLAPSRIARHRGLPVANNEPIVPPPGSTIPGESFRQDKLPLSLSEDEVINDFQALDQLIELSSTSHYR